MWRLNAWPRLIVPPARITKRLAALFLVFIFGIVLFQMLRRSVAANTLRFYNRHRDIVEKE